MTMPKFGSRTYSLHISALPAEELVGKNKIVWNEEVNVGELAMWVPSLTAPAMSALETRTVLTVDRWYKGRALVTAENVYGLKKNGVEKLGSCITLGMLIDVAGLKGIKSIKKGEVISVTDIEACLSKAEAPIG